MMKEELKRCDCGVCGKENCPHRDAFRRLPKEIGGLALCPKLKVVAATIKSH